MTLNHAKSKGFGINLRFIRTVKVYWKTLHLDVNFQGVLWAIEPKKHFWVLNTWLDFYRNCHCFYQVDIGFFIKNHVSTSFRYFDSRQFPMEHIFGD